MADPKSATEAEPQAQVLPPSSPASINEPHTETVEAAEPESINEPQPDVLPAITAIEPDTCAIGDPDFTLDITGTGFGENSVIHFAGYDEPTEFDGVDTVSTGVKPSLWGSPVTVQVSVRNGTVSSDPVDFTFTDAAGATRGGKKQAKLVLHELEPDHAPVGTGPDFHLRVIGEGFDEHCKIVFDDEELPTRCETDKTLVAWAPTAKMPGEVDVEVSRGDDLSEVLTFEFVAKNAKRLLKTERKAVKDTPAHKRAKKR